VATEAVSLKPSARKLRVALFAYVASLLVMFVSWTLIHYLDQPYRSPSYRRHLPQCLGYAAWVVPIEGAGPLVPVGLWSVMAARGPEGLGWTLPAFGGTVYLGLALLMARVGPRWNPLSHVLIGFLWLVAGAWLFTQLTRK
jgi:hypothetical protein